MENNKKKKATNNEEIDPFTAFMFGKTMVNSDRDENRKNRQDSTLTDDWLFGRKNRNESMKSEQNSVSDLLNEIDTEKLMENINLLVETAQEFKPLWKKFSPYLDKLKNNKES